MAVDTLPIPESGSPPLGPAAEAVPQAEPSVHAASSGVVGQVVLDIRDLKTYFFTYDGVVKALDGVSFKIRRGETLGLVGETGCGKSVTAFSVTRLIADPPGRVISGKILYRGADLLWNLDKEAKFKPVKNTGRVKVRRYFRRIKAATERISSVRGGGIAMIFQEPTQAMNPIFSIADQISEAIWLHKGAEVVDGLLSADEQIHSQATKRPEIDTAIQGLIDAAGKGDRTEIIAAAARVGEASDLPSLGTQAYYVARATGPVDTDLQHELHRVLRRTRLSALQRSYLRHQRRVLEIQNKLNSVFVDEMRKQEPLHHDERVARRAMSRERLAHFYFGLWGIRGHVKRPAKEEMEWRSVKLLENVGIANPAQVVRGYPYELSGGMIQRVMIAMALSADPDILIADEPTTALDVTIQAQILEMMRELKTRVGTSILLITHDLAVIAEVADRVCVMYAGQIVETATARDLYRAPLHPYAQGLLASIPRMDQPDKRLTSIPGSVPNLINPPTGCRFHPRCPHAMPICKEERPPTTIEGDRHTVACFLYRGPVAVE